MPGSTKKNRRRLTLAAFAVWSVTLGASSLPAAVLPYTLPLLAQKSRHIIVGEVVALECYRAPFHGLGDVIFTDVVIRVERSLKGAAAGTEIRIQVLGGEIGTAFQHCAESPRFVKGEKVLVFARDYQGALWATGWHQGKYSVDRDGSTVHGDSKLPIGRDVSLAAVEEEVRRAMASASRSVGEGSAGPAQAAAKQEGAAR
jgi:hypothetical protein